MKRLCLFYAAGPGDVVRTFDQWCLGHDDDHQPGITYSAQFFDLCNRLNAKGIAISSCHRKATSFGKGILVANIPKPRMRGALGYHLSQIIYMRRIIALAKGYGADYLILSDATGHWFPLMLTTGKPRIIPTLHCTFWPNWLPVGWKQKALNFLNGLALKRTTHAAIAVSDDVAEQFSKLTAGKQPRTYTFLPTYRSSFFRNLQKPGGKEIFHVLFAGRIEENKGVRDLLHVFQELARRDRRDVHLHICGDGSWSDRLRKEIKARELGETVSFHGFCKHDAYQKLIERAHLFIVPTTKDFNEGFNKVVAEAILSGRPVITTKACPALKKVTHAALEVEPGAIEAYVHAIIRLRDDPDEYQRLCRACSRYQEQFYDLRQSWGRTLATALSAINPELRS